MRHFSSLLCLLLAAACMMPAGCSRQAPVGVANFAKPDPADKTGKPAPVDNTGKPAVVVPAVVQPAVSGPAANAQDLFDNALLHALNLLADRKYPQALAAL